MSTRREFLKNSAMAGAGMALLGGFSAEQAHAFYQSRRLGTTLFTNTIRNVYPLDSNGIPVSIPDGAAPVTGVTHYTFNANQFQDTLHPALGPTTLWGFHSPYNLGGAVPQRHLGGMIIAQKGVPIQVTFRNNLPEKHLLPVDVGQFFPDAAITQNRIAPHLHSGRVPWICDGVPHGYFGSTQTGGGAGSSFINNAVLNPGAPNTQGEFFYPMNQSARMTWVRDQARDLGRLNVYAGMLSAVIVRDNFESNLRNLGLPDFIENGGNEIPLIVQDKIFVNGADIGSGDPSWVAQGLPSTTGSLWYPHVYDDAYEMIRGRWLIGPGGLPLPDPSCVPDMFGDTMLVNGTVCPTATVQARRYRFRFLNACSSRFLNLQLYVSTPGDPNGITLNLVTGRPYNTAFVNAATGSPHFLVIGSDGGLLPYATLVASNQPSGASMLAAPGEAFDFVLDFKNYAGQEVVLYNDAPAPYPKGDPRNDYFPRWNVRNNPVNGTTVPGATPNSRVVMKFKVVPASGPADATLAITGTANGLSGTNLRPGNEALLMEPGTTVANSSVHVPPGVAIRQLTVAEDFDDWGRQLQRIGTNVALYPGTFGRFFTDAPTEVVAAGSTEVWQIANLSDHSCPLHLHLGDVQVLARQAFNTVTYNGTPTYSASARLPLAAERGWKNTVEMHPGDVTTVIVRFELPKTPFAVPPSPRMSVAGIPDGNEYVYESQMLENQDHDMMRPLVVTGAAPCGVIAWPSEPAVGAGGGTITINLTGGYGPYGVAAPAGFGGTAYVAGNVLTITVPGSAPPGAYAFTVTTGTPSDTTVVTVTKF